ncbi:hypothetical protein [Neisseria sp.]|uniref:hypothetical protein n=1 Tax=Neisseria sp. TaxID=192066 RepID=UPI00359F66F8
MMKQIFLGTLLAAAACSAQAECRITENGINGIRLGQSVAQIKAAHLKAGFSTESDAEGAEYTVITFPSKLDVAVFADGGTPKSPITYLSTASPECRTTAGVHPQMKIAEAAKRYGGLKRIEMVEIEARQFARFRKTPAALQFRIDYSGIFPDAGKTDPPLYTRRYEKNGKIDSIEVVKP